MPKTPDYIQKEIVRRFGPRNPALQLGLQLRYKYFLRLREMQKETQMSINCLLTFIICEYLDEIAPKILKLNEERLENERLEAEKKALQPDEELEIG
jgi:type IV secretory pathway VirD2 relaxase